MSTTPDPATSLALADKLFAAIAANDRDALRNEVYAPDVVVWRPPPALVIEVQRCRVRVLVPLEVRMPPGALVTVTPDLGRHGLEDSESLGDLQQLFGSSDKPNGGAVD